MVGRAALLFVVGLTLAGIRPAFAQREAYRLYDEDSGLAYGALNALSQDRAGFLYAATENGLYRYDGLRFSRLGAESGLPITGTVNAVVATPDGRVWVVFPDRVYLLGDASTLSVATEIGTADETGHRAALLGNDLLLIRNHHLLRVHAGPDRTLSVGPFATAPVDTVFVEHDHVWAGCGTRVCQLDGRGVIVPGVGSSLPADRWVALLRDHEGTLWLRSPGRIASLVPGAARFHVVDVPGGASTDILDTSMLELVEDAAGRVVTQSARGLLIHEHGQWIAHDFVQSFPLSWVSTMLVDREGSMWIGSYGRGLVQLPGFGLFRNWTRAEGLADDLVWNASRDGAGTMWVATDLALEMLAGEAAASAAAVPPTHYPGRSLGLARSTGGWLWIGNWSGALLRRAPVTGRTETVAAGLGRIYTIVPDPSGPLWISAAKGLFRIARPDDAVLPTAEPVPGIHERVLSMTFDSAGEPWVLTDFTLFHRDARQDWHAVLRIDPTGGRQTRSLAFAPDGTLWLGSFISGLTRLRLDHGVIVGSDRRPSEHLFSQDVEMIHSDRSGRIWIGTDQGIDVTDGVHWRHLDTQDGLVANDSDQNAAYTDDDGSLWFGMSGGLSHLTDTRTLFHPVSLHPLITSVSLDDAAVPRPGRLATHLRWTGDPLLIDFAALDFKYARTIRFRYRLLGFDRGWTETTIREARYTNPPSGRLVFELVAYEPTHRLTSRVVRITIKLRPPWWMTWPVYAGLAMAAVLLLALLWRLRVRYLLRRQRLLEAEVARRTCEIEEARSILFKQATFDTLTGLLTRAAIMERLRLAIEHGAASGTPLAIALLDLDHFKRVNDTYGHLGGDAVLAEIGRRLLASTRENDEVGRYGGEEVMVVMPGLKHDTFERVERLLCAMFAAPIAFEDVTITMTGSVGVTWMRVGDDVSTIIARADAALYTAKREGRDRAVFAPSRASRAEDSDPGHNETQCADAPDYEGDAEVLAAIRLC